VAWTPAELRQTLGLIVSNKALESDRDRWKEEATYYRLCLRAWMERGSEDFVRRELETAMRDLALAESREDDLRHRLREEQTRHANTAMAGRDYVDQIDQLRRQLAQAERDLRETRDQHRNVANSYRMLEENFENECDRASRAAVCIAAIADETKESWWYGRHPRTDVLRTAIRDWEESNRTDPPDEGGEADDIPF
jgi:DNA repair exonuclease SbcCD ATPase subunit